MEWFDHISEFIANIGWQLTLLIVVFVFKNPMSGLINRIIKISKSGVECSQPTESRNLLDFEALVAIKGYSKGTEEYIKELSQWLEDQLKAKIHSTTDIKELLKLAVVDSLGALNLERIYSNIYGSQINAIKYLSDKDNAKLSDIRIFYDDASRTYEEVYKSMSFEAWVHYLSINNLVTVSDDNIKLKPAGKAFIPYLSSSKINYSKIF